jgi:hypothetical protein
MKDVTSHHSDRFNRRIHVAALDQSKAIYGLWADGVPGVTLRFQQGDPAEVGPNGFTPEAVFALLADKFAEDPEVLAHVAPAFEVLKKRAAAKEAERVAEEGRRATEERERERAAAEADAVATAEGAARAEDEVAVADEAERLRLEDEAARRKDEELQRQRDEERRANGTG